MPHLFDNTDPDWREKVWSKPGGRGMSLKDREKFVPQKYLRRWEEGNEEMFLRALKRFKSLKLRVIFQLEEDKEDIARRRGKNKLGGFGDKHWTTIRGKTVFVKKIPNQGMLIQLIKSMQEAALGVAKR